MFDTARRDEAARSVDRLATAQALRARVAEVGDRRRALLADAVEEGARAAQRDLRYTGALQPLGVVEVASFEAYPDSTGQQAAWVSGYAAVAEALGAWA